MPYLVLGAAQLAVGAAAIFARFALGGAQPLGVAATRLVIAAAILLGYAALVSRREATQHERPTPRARWLLAGAGVALAIHFATWIGSLDYTTVAVSTLLVTSTPIWTALYDALVLHRPLSRLATMAFFVGGIGLLMVVGLDATAPPFPGHELLGAGLALTGSLAIGTYLILVREVRDVLSTRTIVTQTYSWAALVLVLAALIARQGPPPLDATAAWAGILAMALISQLLGHTALNAGLHWFSPSAISFATLLEPVIAGGLALAIFGEAIPPLALLGGVLLLAAVGVVVSQERRLIDNEL